VKSVCFKNKGKYGISFINSGNKNNQTTKYIHKFQSGLNLK